MRARRFAERGWVAWLPPASLSAENLTTAVLDALDSPADPASRPPDMLGRQRAARHLLDAEFRSVADEVIFSPTGLDDLVGAGPPMFGEV